MRCKEDYLGIFYLPEFHLHNQRQQEIAKYADMCIALAMYVK